MASFRQQALIDAPIEEVWTMVADPVKGPQWSEDVIAITGAPTKIEKGSTFMMTARGPMGIKGTTPFKVEELEDMHEIKMTCQVSGYYSRWVLTEAQGGTFTELELGFDHLNRRRSLQAAAMTALHTQSYLRRTVEKLLDSLRGAVSRERTTAS